MKDIASFLTTLSILVFYIALVASPMAMVLHKKGLLNSKSRLLFLYVLLVFASLVSLFAPEVAIVSTIAKQIGYTQVGDMMSVVSQEFLLSLYSFFESEGSAYRTMMISITVVGLVGISLYLLSLVAIVRKIRSLETVRRIGKISILREEKNIIPHVFSLLGKSYIVLPANVFSQKKLMKTALQHELQHIRNGDTSNIYLLQLVKCLMWINPAVHIVLSQIKNLQELRVDENLVHEKKVGYRNYLHTLQWFTCESGRQSQFSFSYAVFGWSTFRELKNRIQNIHRVRPLRTQPVVLGTLFLANIFVLLLISNSSPRFNYSLREIQRMYMPEYMKTTFEIAHGPDIDFRPFTTSIEFAKEHTFLGYSHEALKERIKEEENREKKAKRVEARNSYAPLKDSLWVSNSTTMKVIEYSDVEAVIKIEAKVYSKRGEETTDIKVYEDTVRTPYDTKFRIANLEGSYEIRKKSKPDTIAYIRRPIHPGYANNYKKKGM